MDKREDRDAPAPPRPLAVCAVVRRADGRYLMIRRALDRPGGGYWTPVTGRPERREALPSAAAREVAEEVGLEVDVGAEIHRCPTSNRAWTLVWFEATPTSPAAARGPLSLQREEVADAGWFTAAEVLGLEPLFDATRRFFERLARA